MSLESVIRDIALCLPLRSVGDDLAVNVLSDESLKPSVRVFIVRVPRISVPVRIGKGNITG